MRVQRLLCGCIGGVCLDTRQIEIQKKQSELTIDDQMYLCAYENGYGLLHKDIQINRINEKRREKRR